ncbi:DUF4199 domain-containing protein [Mucilaginibacter sp. Bleaf8]|uniref:DUF4199 domain-containing protein n=1 Tax=Mucilaginibacter sp. Bleaf8 TaxID=2834430 RepID=UPI001BCF802B|nr:DUF4199 domain-containing protein [Mucilaginibacter sp. Bleaf8]MBS7563765.1 DUF4199 domain-containing protein [Mucilaginibacter sp. Bleaf8]
MENLNNVIRKEGTLRGLLFGGILLVVNILLVYCTAYWVSSPLVYFFISFIGTYVIQLGLTLFLTSKLRKKIGGYWSLKQAATGIFFILLFTYLISTGGRWLYFKLIDPPAMEAANTNSVNIRRGALEFAHRPQKDIDTTIAEMQKSIEQGKVFTIGKTIQDFVISIILLFAVALILGALYKREGAVNKA